MTIIPILQQGQREKSAPVSSNMRSRLDRLGISGKAALRESLLLRAIGQKTEVTDAHETVG